MHKATRSENVQQELTDGIVYMCLRSKTLAAPNGATPDSHSFEAGLAPYQEPTPVHGETGIDGTVHGQSLLQFKKQLEHKRRNRIRVLRLHSGLQSKQNVHRRARACLLNTPSVLELESGITAAAPCVRSAYARRGGRRRLCTK